MSDEDYPEGAHGSRRNRAHQRADHAAHTSTRGALSDAERRKSNNRTALEHDSALAPLSDLLVRCQEDPPAVLEDEALDKIADLKFAKPASFARLRRVLKDLGAPVAELDSQIKSLLAERRREQMDRAKVEAKTVANTTAKKNVSSDDDERPHVPRLVINDTTIERAAMIAAKQLKGLFILRDELSGWVGNMSRYAKGGSDRGFWTEGYNGGSYVVERVTRSADEVDRLTIGILGGIQPDKLSSLLINVDDDGMLARFMPFWPTPVPVNRPVGSPDQLLPKRAFRRLYHLTMTSSITERAPRPEIVRLEEAACVRLDRLRHWRREQEGDEAGLMLSFIGKMPGLMARITLILAYLDWSVGDDPKPPEVIGDEHAARAEKFVREYLFPMAKRTYAEASVPAEVRGARRLAQMIVKERIQTFTQRDITRRERQGLKTSIEVESALDVLIQAGWIKQESKGSGPKGGRPQLIYSVNTRVHELARVESKKGFGGFGSFDGGVPGET